MRLKGSQLPQARLDEEARNEIHLEGGRVKIVITDGPDPNDSDWQWGDPWPGEANA